jgi:diaminohydroxyphosphoribosylaminopyrimidine deaminase/5-amino-6-(5-phosphoribosylamino)uracil reductase
MGIEVNTGVLEKKCRQLNESYLKFVTQGRPFVMVKSALTLDGWTATATGHSRWVTNDRSRQFVHGLRSQMDAVMVGIGTILSDDPSLTSRPNRGFRKDPVRVVVDTRLRIPSHVKVLNLDSSAKTLIVVGPDVPDELLDRVRKEGVSSVRCPLKDGGIDLTALLGILGNMGVTSVLVEGGARLLGSLIRQGLPDKFFIFKAPKILGGDDGVPMASGPGAKLMDQCLTLTDVRVKRFGEDVLITGYPCQRPPI